MYDKYIQRRDHKKYDRCAQAERPIAASGYSGAIPGHVTRPDIARQSRSKVPAFHGEGRAASECRKASNQPIPANVTRRVLARLDLTNDRVAQSGKINEDRARKPAENRDRAAWPNRKRAARVSIANKAARRHERGSALAIGSQQRR